MAEFLYIDKDRNKHRASLDVVSEIGEDSFTILLKINNVTLGHIKMSREETTNLFMLGHDNKH